MRNNSGIPKGKLIRARREELGMSQGELASRVGIRQPSLHNIEIGKTKNTRHAPEIANALDLDPMTMRPINPAPIRENVAATPRRGSLGELQIFFAHPGDREECLVLNLENAEKAERPPLLATTKNAYGICIYGDAMSPAYESGDVVFVHPYKPPVPGSDVVLRPTKDSDSRIYIGRLVGDTPTEWTIRQHKKEKDICVRKAEWGRCERILIKYNRV